MVTIHHAVAMLLLFIGHGCSHKITGAFCGFAKETVCFHVSKMRSIFITHVAPNCIRWPSSDEEIQKIKQDFLDRGYIENVVGAIDGTHIPILIPEDDHMDFLNRKSYHSLVFQAIAIGTNLKFIDLYGGWAGSVHDAQVFQNSSIFRKFTSGLYAGCVLLADAAYPLAVWCLTPFERKQQQPLHEANYNFWHSSARMTVERAFGVLKKRFPILKKPWTSNVQQVVEVMTICVALHNLCCDADSEWDAQRLKMHIENTRNEGPEDLYFDMECNVNQRGASREAKVSRAQIAQQVPSQPKQAIPANIVSV